ncbi:hypothetical protein R1sor_011069 [Riccia sorocarpa]|uniref:Uncharacterized protein n=1 Tax=Riccia sorocarpa TaxID=122646 RepID=A0ABD3HZV6_9MARC
MAMLAVGTTTGTTISPLYTAPTRKSLSQLGGASLVSVSCSSNFHFSPLRSSTAFSSQSIRKLISEIHSRKVAPLSSKIAVPRCEESGESKEKVPFGYTRKDVILIGVGLLLAGYGLKYGLEAFGLDTARAGNAVQLIMVLGLTIGWIASYVFRVSNKDMTYAKQLKDYENKVMQKRLEELPEAELEAMLAQIEEEKRILRESRKNMN